MTGRTHRTGGMLCAMVGFLFLRANNLLYGNIQPLLQLMIMYPFAVWGSICSDLDHHWSSCPDKSIFSRIINFLLHIGKPVEDRVKGTALEKNKGVKVFCTLFNARHRSWQTHSDVTLIVMLVLLKHILDGNLLGWALSKQDIVLASLLVTGIVMGVMAHFIYDMLTPEGIMLVGCTLINRAAGRHILPEKVRLVPKAGIFATGGSWETFIRKLSQIATWIVAVYIVATTINPDIITEIATRLK